jgi:hypothetical protein
MQGMQTQIHAKWKTREYSEEIKLQAIKTYYTGTSGRGVGKIMGFSKANVYNWIKKTAQNPNPNYHILELDELYWFIGQKPRTQTRENLYLMTMINANPRQIVGLQVTMDKGATHIQDIVDNAPWAEQYATDGYFGYCDVVFPGEHIRNIRDKTNTHNVESINADLRHYIPVLRRRSRCFCRKP